MKCFHSLQSVIFYNIWKIKAIFNCENQANLAILWESFLQGHFVIQNTANHVKAQWTNKASTSGAGDCGFKFHLGCFILYVFIRYVPKLLGQRKDICIIFSVLYQGNLEKVLRQPDIALTSNYGRCICEDYLQYD